MPVVSVDTQAIPMVRTADVSALISDSGITRYRLEAKIWDMYSNEENAYSHFPEGIYVERFDSLLTAEGYIKADTAYHFDKKGLWQLIGSVFVKNIEGRTFETEELFWKEESNPNSLEAFYTDKFVKITEANGDVRYGRKGFKSNQSMSDIVFLSFGGELSVDESPNVEADNIQKDSIQSHE
ncbi:LPS export ABC transporter periplasmic protein LptC [Bacteroidia bacterium]|nr:LPS export ABC transporter periplasmic protein LptC [Bacteroidia bacterium]